MIAKEFCCSSSSFFAFIAAYFLHVSLLFLQILNSGAEVYTAVAHVERMLTAEHMIPDIVNAYINAEMDRLDELKRIVADYMENNNRDQLDLSLKLENPVGIFTFIKRVAMDWNSIEELMQENLAEEYLQDIAELREVENVTFLTLDDVEGAAVSLLRIQDTYLLNESKIADGIIPGGSVLQDRLTASDCFDIANVAYKKNDSYHTLLWTLEAWRRLEHEHPQTAEEAEILELLAYAAYEQDNIEWALHYTKLLLAIDPQHERASSNLEHFEDLLSKDGRLYRFWDEYPPLKLERAFPDGRVASQETYEALCRGENLLPPKNSSELYCFYKNDHPFLKIAPIKTELVHLRPAIYMYRNVIHDDEINGLISLSLHQLDRAKVRNATSGAGVASAHRIAKNTWFQDDDEPIAARISQRTQLITGLAMITAEGLQVANYGLGGHYNPHYDFSTTGVVKTAGNYTGGRIATVLFYLSTPKSGGATVFPELKVGVMPTKNDAVFWHNLFRNGEGDRTTRHAACPVVAGSKWVANKWIHEYGQEFLRPCGLDEWDYS